jgi:hypothetical protein
MGPIWVQFFGERAFARQTRSYVDQIPSRGRWSGPMPFTSLRVDATEPLALMAITLRAYRDHEGLLEAAGLLE